MNTVVTGLYRNSTAGDINSFGAGSTVEMNAVICRVYADITACDNDAAVGFDTLCACVLVKLRSICGTAARHYVKSTVIHGEPAVGLNSVLRAGDIDSTVVDRHSTLGSRVVLIGRGFESVTVRGDVDRTAVHHYTAVACHSVICSGNCKSEAVGRVLTDNKLGFGSALDAVLAVRSVNIESAVARYGNGSAALYLYSRSVLVGVCKAAVALNDYFHRGILADLHSAFVCGRECQILEYQRNAVAVFLYGNAAVLTASGDHISTDTGDRDDSALDRISGSGYRSVAVSRCGNIGTSVVCEQIIVITVVCAYRNARYRTCE